MAPKTRGSKRVASVALAVVDVEEALTSLEVVVAAVAVTDPRLDAVVEALIAAELPEECRAMLLAMVPGSLGVPTAQRGDLQGMAVEMIGDTVGVRQATLERACADEAAKLSDVEASRTSVDAALAATLAVAAERASEVESQKAVLASTSSAMLAAKQALSAAQEAQRSGDAALVEVAELRKALEIALQQHFEPLKTGNWQTGQSKLHIDVIIPIMKRIMLDESLATALPSSCTKLPAERGAFDKMVLEQLESSMQAKIIVLAQEHDEAGPASAERAAAVAAAERDFSAAKEQQQGAAAKLAAANDALRNQQAVVEHATAAVEASKPEYLLATKVRDERQSELAAFHAGALAAFESLRRGDCLAASEEVLPAAKVAKVE